MMKGTPSPFFWFDIWLEGCTTGLRLFETIAAVPVVVNARMPMIAAAACNPLTGNWPEIYTMVAEKAQAFTLAGLSLAQDMQAIQGQVMEPRGHATSAAASSMHIGHHVIGSAGRALAPIHAVVTDNALRLQERAEQ
jgi:hypothetical protein